ncbi:Flagellar hook-basal body complex protein FliE 1 [Candidatus Terasakiella magnetica]|nr:Flagellar hook-basal body complex protein FliE 1 [Candidatus Terasakiella magnetica]
MTRINDAISAYANAANPFGAISKAASGGGAAEGAETGTDFASVLKDAAKMAVGTVKGAETASMAAISGKADIREVVAAVANAELTLETVVNVRDKVITAYNEILRMPI